MTFKKYVLTFTRTHTTTTEKLSAKLKYSPELGDDVSTDVNAHIERSVYNPNLNILPYLGGKITRIDQVMMRRITEYTRFRYFVHYDINYASKSPVVTDHCSLPIFNEEEETIVLKYIRSGNGFRNIKKVPFVESEWDKKKVTFLPEVEEMYSRFMEAD